MIRANSSIRAVLFDHDDTLVNTIEVCWALDKYVARTWYNKELTEDELRQNWHLPLKDMLGIIFNTSNVELAQERVRSCYPQFPKEFFPRVSKVFHALRERDMYIGIVSSTARELFEKDIHMMPPLLPLIDYIQTQEDTAYHKPDARVFEPTKEWLQSLEIEDHQVMYVGDGLHDATAAIEAGFHFVGTETGLVTKEQFAARNLLSIENIGQLTSVL